MRKTIFLPISIFCLVITLISSVSAYYDCDRVYNYNNDHFSYTYVGYNDEAFISLSLKDRNYDDHDHENLYKYINTWQKRRVALWILDSHYERYDFGAGKTSAEMYCMDCDTDQSSMSFGNKPVYDPRVDGIGSSTNYYYKPEFDEDLGYYNWRY